MATGRSQTRGDMNVNGLVFTKGMVNTGKTLKGYKTLAVDEDYALASDTDARIVIPDDASTIEVTGPAKTKLLFIPYPWESKGRSIDIILRETGYDSATAPLILVYPDYIDSSGDTVDASGVLKIAATDTIQTIISDGVTWLFMESGAVTSPTPVVLDTLTPDDTE